MCLEKRRSEYCKILLWNCLEFRKFIWYGTTSSLRYRRRNVIAKLCVCSPWYTDCWVIQIQKKFAFSSKVLRYGYLKTFLNVTHDQSALKKALNAYAKAVRDNEIEIHIDLLPLNTENWSLYFVSSRCIPQRIDRMSRKICIKAKLNDKWFLDLRIFRWLSIGFWRLPQSATVGSSSVWSSRSD